MANSFKQMTKAGVIKRTDTGMFIALSDIHVREGFNKREDDERTRQADDDLFNYLMNGGSVPPLEVIARDEGGVWVVEGHRRRRCYARCAESGKPVDRIHIMPFNGNDVQRLARIMTSNNQLPLRDKLGLCDHLPLDERPTFHEIRALAAHLFDSQGIDPQGRMAHSDAKSTKIYTSNHIDWVMVPHGEIKAG